MLIGMMLALAGGCDESDDDDDVADANASAPGSCEWEGQTYAPGASWPKDACNVFVCLDGEIICTDVLCLDAGAGVDAGVDAD
jgi:hypothetical protein